MFVGTSARKQKHLQILLPGYEKHFTLSNDKELNTIPRNSPLKCSSIQQMFLRIQDPEIPLFSMSEKLQRLPAHLVTVIISETFNISPTLPFTKVNTFLQSNLQVCHHNKIVTGAQPGFSKGGGVDFVFKRAKQGTSEVSVGFRGEAPEDIPFPWI